MPVLSNKPSTPADEREKWFKLVMKIMSWKENASQRGMSNSKPRITSKEWHYYTSQMLKMQEGNNKKDTKEKLDETKKIIEAAGGFE